MRVRRLDGMSSTQALLDKPAVAPNADLQPDTAAPQWKRVLPEAALERKGIISAAGT